MEKVQVRYRQRGQELESKLVSLGDPQFLEPQTRLLALAAAATAAGRRDPTRVVLAFALARGIRPELLREAILQTYLFAGYPRAINALAVLHSLLPEEERVPEVDLEPRTGETAMWAADGEALCRRVYRDKYPSLLRTMARLSPDLARWMVLEGYGKVLSRPHLPPVTRELVAVAALIPLSVPDQLRAHLRGTLFVGASEGAVREVIAAVAMLGSAGVRSAETLVDLVVQESSEHGH
jgi:4-carboxymuconolactone decarboxylase